MIITKESHVDHSLSAKVQEHILGLFKEKKEFFIATIELPAELGTVPCGLYGPLMGDAPVTEVTLVKRGTREWTSRVVSLPTRETRVVSIIAGPHENEPCILYTAFGGPVAPQEPGDPGCRNLEESNSFWAKHALSA